MISQRACRQCRYITNLPKCPLCSGETSREWQGYLVVMEPDKSEIAKKMGIKVQGRYALRVK